MCSPLSSYSCVASTSSLQPSHVWTVSTSIAFAARVLAVAFCLDPSQRRELDWRVQVAALVALGHVGHLTDHCVLVATLATLKVADPNSDLLTNRGSSIPHIAAATFRVWIVIRYSYMPPFDVIVILSWLTVWTFKLPPVPRHCLHCCSL